MMLKEYRDALPFYLQLISENPDNANLNYRTGMCYLNIKGQKEKAIPHLEKAINDLTARYKEGNFKEEKAPYDAYFFLANAYLINNEIPKAQRTFEKYLNFLDPGDTININFVKKNRIMPKCKAIKRK